MVKRKVTVVLFHDDEAGGYVAVMPTFPHCTTQGDTVGHALAMAKECLELNLQEPTDWDLFDLDHAYSEHVVVGTVEVDVPLRRSRQSRWETQRRQTSRCGNNGGLTMRLEGKVALISGGARGQGAAEARLFAREGAAVVIGDILDEEGIRLEAEIRELGGQATYVHLDVTQPEQWENAVGQAVDRYGKLDVLVNNAGIGSTSTGGLDAPKIEGASVEIWDTIMDVNSKGVFLGTRAAIPALRAAGGGSIVNISSIAGIVGLSPGHRRGRGLRRIQGLGEAANQVHRRPVRRRGHSLQFGASWVHRHGDDRAHDVPARHPRSAHRRDTHSPHWYGGRYRQRSPLPGVRRIVFHGPAASWCWTAAGPRSNHG